MKKKLAMLLAGVMALSMVPMTAFAKSTNRVTNVAVAKVDTVLGETKAAPSLKLKGDDFGLNTTTESFKLTLTNAEWDKDANFAAALPAGAVVNFITDTMAVFEVKPTTDTIVVPMYTKLTAKGDATVTVDPRESTITAGEYKFATVTGGAVAVSTLGVKNVPERNGEELKAILIEEVVAGSIDETKELNLRLTKGWSFVNTATVDYDVHPAGAVTLTTDVAKTSGRELVLDVVVDEAVANGEAIIITLKPEVEWDENKVDAGDICEVVISGAVDKTELEVAKAISYGFAFDAEDKALKEIYWGRTGDVLKVTFEETIEDSWHVQKKTQIAFNEEVRVNSVTITGSVADTDTFTATDLEEDYFTINSDRNVLTFTPAWEAVAAAGRVDVTFKFNVDVEAGYTGEITATLKGKGVEGEEFAAVLGTAVAPVTVEVEKSDVVIDYRHTSVGDIVVTEAEAGLLTDGAFLAFALEKLSFDDEPEVEVLAGDIEVKDPVVIDGVVFVEIKNESVKEAGSFKITGATLYMERNIPAGDFYLKLVDPATLGAKVPTAFAAADDVLFVNNFGQKLTVAKDYVSVVTAGRDVDETFTTTLVVTAGATEMKANDKVIALDVPAYITNDGRMMLPVRAVIEALSGSAIVAWDDAAKQITISTGSRVVAMKVGSDVMSINGVEVPMVKACEIVDSRAFVPVRDLGYALGLNDASIAYDAATSTATLN